MHKKLAAGGWVGLVNVWWTTRGEGVRGHEASSVISKITNICTQVADNIHITTHEGGLVREEVAGGRKSNCRCHIRTWTTDVSSDE